MFLAETNKVKRLLHLSFIGHVQVSELQENRDKVMLLLAELPGGFRLLTDLSHLESMETACEAEIARIMEVCDQKGIGSVIRVIPEPQKDIGFNILTAFHYKRRVRVSTCRSLEDAVRMLNDAAPQ